MKKPQVAAAKTDFLAERIRQNESNQSLDINEWAFNKIEGSIEHLNILELCCGTGRQSAYLAKKFPKSNLTFVDLSEDAVKTVRESDFFDINRMQSIASGLDSFFEGNNHKYDLVFVSYGLYYANDMTAVINCIVSALNVGGSFIVLGPYGVNNKKLFDLVEFSGFEIDDFVKYSCTDFMYDKVLGLTLGKFERFVIDTAINRVDWKSSKDLINYWRSTTFYSSKCEEKFSRELNKIIDENGSFPIEKHIMLFHGIMKYPRG